ncbi:MAG TPA: hypothetical protein VG013_37100 [Gemmataceae bacterium]|jgi:hypothetical protein|nr:hypothetical protein [Gemmataceae bacterium]
MRGELLGHCRFTDGATRPVYAEGDRQYTYDNDGELVHGLFLIPREECADLPVIVEGEATNEPDAGNPGPRP